MERAKVARDEGRWLVAGLKAEIWNVNLAADDRLSAADFMPGRKSEEDEMREFVEKVQRGESFSIDPAQATEFRRKMEESFRNVKKPELVKFH